MQTVDETPATIHIYYEGERPPSLFPIWLSLFVFFCLLLIGIFPFPKLVTRETIKVPAILLPLRTFTAQVSIIPTGKKTIPAARARGILTITNGSVISQIIPPGFIVDGAATDTSVFVPAGSANGYGYATVSAHALVSGKGGDFATFSIDTVEGASLYIRNLTAFTGGENSYLVKFITSKDRQRALSKARTILTSNVTSTNTFTTQTFRPCKESDHFPDITKLVVRFSCRPVTYSIPSYMHVTGVRLVGKTVLVDVWFAVRPIPYPVK